MEKTTLEGSIPKVFISYSWTPPENKEKVCALVEKLKRDGINVIIDYTHLKPGQDKFAFMEQMVCDLSIHKVLIICNQNYAKKADSRKGGVGTEAEIITSEIYGKVMQEKFIPVAFEKDASNDNEPFLPIYLKTRVYIDLSDDKTFDAEYTNLLKNLRGSDNHANLPTQSKLFERTLTLKLNEYDELVIDSELRGQLQEWSVNKDKYPLSIEIKSSTSAIVSNLFEKYSKKLKMEGALSDDDERQYLASHKYLEASNKSKQQKEKAVSFFLKDAVFHSYAHLDTTKKYIDLISKILEPVGLRDSSTTPIDCFIRANPKRKIRKDYGFRINVKDDNPLIAKYANCPYAISGDVLDLGHDTLCDVVAPAFYTFLAQKAMSDEAFFDDNIELQNMFYYQIGLG